MTRDDVIDALSFVVVKWPHAKLGAREEAIAGWLDELAGLDRQDVEAALRRLSGSGREFAPTAGQVAQEVRLALQGTPPSFDELQAFLSRYVHLLPYGQRNTPQDTAMAIAALAAVGAHETLLRFVQANGVYAVRMMPDASLQPLDPNQLADRRDMARGYQQSVVPAWTRNPQPGLALERACDRAGLDAVELRELAVAARRERLASAARPALPQGEPVEDDEPTISPDEALRAYRAELAKMNARRRAEFAARRRAEQVERHAALAELAEHAGSAR